MPSPSMKTSLAEYLRILFQRKWIIVVPIIMCTGFAFWIANFMIQPEYKAYSTFSVQEKMKGTLIGLSVTSELNERLPEIIKRLKYGENIAQVGVQLGWLRSAEERENELVEKRKVIEAQARAKYGNDAAKAAAAVKKEFALVRDEAEERYRQKRNGVITKIKNGINITFVGPNLMAINYFTTKKKGAEKVVEEVFNLFRRINLTYLQEEIQGAGKFLAAEEERSRKLLDAAELKLRRYEEKHKNLERIKDPALTPGEKVVILQQTGGNMNALKGQLLERHKEMQDLNMEIADLKQQKDQFERRKKGEELEAKEVLESIQKTDTPAVLLLKGKLAEIILKEEELKGDRSEAHPYVRALKRKRQALEARITSLQAQYPGEVKDMEKQPTTAREDKETAWLKRQIAAVSEKMVRRQVQKDQLAKIIDNLQQQIDEFPGLEAEQRRLHDKVEYERSHYKNILSRLQKTNITRRFEIAKRATTFNVVMPAIVSSKPVRPNKPMLIILGFVIGFSIAAALVFFIEYADHSLKGIEDARKYLTVPLLGVVPDFSLQHMEDRARTVDKWHMWRRRKESEGEGAGGRGLEKPPHRAVLLPILLLLLLLTVVTALILFWGPSEVGRNILHYFNIKTPENAAPAEPERDTKPAATKPTPSFGLPVGGKGPARKPKVPEEKIGE